METMNWIVLDYVCGRERCAHAFTGTEENYESVKDFTVDKYEAVYEAEAEGRKLFKGAAFKVICIGISSRNEFEFDAIS